MAGPASITGLLRYAKRCGVSASLRGLISGTGTGLIGQVTGIAGPGAIIGAWRRPAISAPRRIIFPFGGAVETARYACEAAAGRFAA